jgi:hypothetical protein
MNSTVKEAGVHLKIVRRSPFAKARKTNAGRWSPSGSTGDLPTIAFIRAGPLLRRNGPVPGILAAHRPGAIMDKSGRRFVVRFGVGRGQKAIPARRKNRNTFSQLLTKRKASQMAETKTLTVLPMS